MAAANACPDRSCLQTLLAGQLAPSEQEPVIRHVETCASCQRVLDSLTPASRSWEDVAVQLRQEQRTPAPPVLQRVMERAKAAFAPFKHAEMPPVFKRMRDYVLHMQD